MTIDFKIEAYLDSAWTNITGDVSSNASAQWGGDNKPTDFLSQTGQMTFSLNNNTGKYTPGGSAVISDDWKKGTKLRAIFTFSSQEWKRFYGTIDSMKIDAGTLGNRKVHVTVLDWMNYASNYPLNNPAVATDQTIDQAVNTILAEMPIQPLATDIETGVNIFPTVFNDAVLETRAYSELQKLAISEFAYIYVQKDKDNGETLRVESAETRVNPIVKQVAVEDVSENILDETGAAILDEASNNILDEVNTAQDVRIDNTMLAMDITYGEDLINRVSTTANPTRIDDKDTLLYQLDSPLYFVAGETKNFFVEFTENSSKRKVSALPPETSYPTTLLHFDTPGTEELIVDEAGKPFDDYNMELVANVKKFGSQAGYFAGNAYIDASSSVDYDLTGDFTIEYWAYYFNATAGGAVVSRGPSSYVPYVMGVPDGTNALLYMSSNGSSWDVANAVSFGAIALNTWTKYSLTRSGNNFYMAVNGSIVNTFTSSATLPASTANLTIGKYNSAFITACIDELRITKGLARYPENYIVESEPFSLSGLIYAAWTNANGTGEEITEDFTVTVDYGAAGAWVTVENTGVAVGYLTTLKINGKIIETVSTITDVQQDTASIQAYGYHELNINQPYQQDFVNGREKAAEILAAYKEPRTRIDKVTMNANRDNAHTSYFLNTDIGDAVEIAETQSETDALFHIHGMGWDAAPGDGGAIVNYWWKVKKIRDNSSPIALKVFSQTSTTTGDRIDFGYLPQIAVEQVPHRIWSWWAKFDTNAIDDTQNFFDTLSANAVVLSSGYRIRFAARQAEFLFSTLTGGYINSFAFDSYPNTPNTWMHFMVSYDARDVSNQPRLFYNGVEELPIYPDPSNPYSGNISSEVGNSLKIGQKVTVDATYGTTIKDVRIYNADEVLDIQQLATALAAETPYGDENKRGLLFRGFNILTAKLSQYVGATLTEDQTVTDDIGQATGTPINGPVGVSA